MIRMHKRDFTLAMPWVLIVALFQASYLGAAGAPVRPSSPMKLSAPSTLGDPVAVQALRLGLVEPLGLVSLDFDQDGTLDLARNFATLEGGLTSLRRGRGSSAAEPYHAEAWVLTWPVRPDWLLSGDFDADGRTDLLAAAAGGEALYLRYGAGSGSFSALSSKSLPGKLTALTVGEVNRRDGLSDLAVAIEGPGGAAVLVFESPEGAVVAEAERIGLPAAATAVFIGRFDEDQHGDLVVVSRREVMLVSGRDRRLSWQAPGGVTPARIQRTPVAAPVVASCTGNFAGDATLELALEAESGQLQVYSWAAADDGSPIDPLISHLDPGERSRWLSLRLPGRAHDALMGWDSSGHRLWQMAPGGELSAARPRATWGPAGLDLKAVATSGLQSVASGLVVLEQGRIDPLWVTFTKGLGFVVDSVGDLGDALPGDGVCEAIDGTCTLRAAIVEANAIAGLDTITFTAGVTVAILLGSPLTVTDPVILDGTSHPDFIDAPVVELDASGMGGGSALDLGAGSDGSTVRGLVIHGAPEAGIKIGGSGGNTIAGNYLGTGVAGASAMGNGDGIKIVGTAVGNVLGGLAPGDGNLISGNSSDGIDLEVSGAVTDTLVQGNRIGTDASGLLALGNAEHGIHIGSASGTFGGTTPAALNLIAFNGMHGIFLRASDNLVQGNWIGVSAAGTAAGNLGDGVNFGGGPGSGESTIGGTSAGAGNVISGNGGDGVRFAIGVDNLVQGNRIGTDPTGLIAVGNGGYGVCDGCSGGFRNTIGGVVAGAGNVISANTLAGYATGSFDSVVQGNIIGLAADGEGLLGNGGAGVAGSDTLVGGSAPLAGNLISANTGAGVTIGTDTAILGNRIGVTASGAAAGNGGFGVQVLGVRTDVGGAAVGEGNVIAFNGSDGVAVTDFGSLNTISGNSIFGNTGLGIDLDDDGVTANDSGDPDVGSNDLQNFPVLTSANAGNGAITGTLDGVAGALHVLEVFASAGCDPSGNGEGGTYLGSGTVTTDGSGTGVAFAFAVHPIFAVGSAITATATNPGGSTSEFSACLDATLTTISIFSDGFESGDTTGWSSATR